MSERIGQTQQTWRHFLHIDTDSDGGRARGSGTGETPLVRQRAVIPRVGGQPGRKGESGPPATVLHDGALPRIAEAPTPQEHGLEADACRKPLTAARGMPQPLVFLLLLGSQKPKGPRFPVGQWWH